MKRTKSVITLRSVRAGMRATSTPVALAVTAVFMLAGCEENDETVSLYQNADDCSVHRQATECKRRTNALKRSGTYRAGNMPPREDYCGGVW